MAATSGTLFHQSGQLNEDVRSEAEHHLQHPRPKQAQRYEHRQNLGNVGQRHLVDLGDRLEDADREPHDKPEAEHRRRDHEGQGHTVTNHVDQGVLGHVLKLVTRDLTMRYQPSTMTNSSSLKGSEISAGGSMIMPIEMSVLATTMSMIRKGMKMKKPIWKAVFSSLMMNAGMSV